MFDQLFPGQGEMSRRLRAYDWSQLPWGAPETWPASLRTAVGICLASPVPTYVGWGADLNLLYNDACIPLLGARHPQALGCDARLAWPEIWSATATPIEGLYLEPAKYAASRGDQPHLRHSLSPIYDGPRPAGLFGTCVAIAEPPSRSLASEESAEASAKFRAMFDQGTQFAALLSREGRVVEVNRLALDACGYRREEMIGQLFWDCGWWAGAAGVSRLVREACAGAAQGRSFTGQTSYFVADGSERFSDLSISPVVDEDGETLFISAAGIDITERMRAESALFESRSEVETQRRIYEAILSNTPDLAYVFDLDHRFIYINDSLLKMWGRSAEESLGKTCLELGYEPWHADMHNREIDQVAATGLPIRGEVPFNGTGGRRIYDYIFVPVFNSRGEVAFVAGTTRDVTDRQHDEQRLRSLANDLTESNRRKTEFLAMLAHELRNPLAPIRNALQVMRRADAAPAVRDNSLAMIERQLAQLVRLVDDLIDVSRISRGVIELRPERIELAAVVQQAVETVRPALDKAGHRLQLSLPAEPVALQADPVRLTQVLANLLSNACRYSPPGSAIELSAQCADGELVLSVRDNGIGIAPAMLGKVFEMFVQADRSIEGAQGGLGIGLALVRSLVELHGGRVEAISSGLDAGSEFRVHLPLPAPDTAIAPAAAPRRAGELGGYRVLVVDDNEDSAASMAMLLEMSGAQISVAHDGPEALETVASFRPDAVVLDIGLPSMSGLEVCRRLRQSDGGRPVLVALTGWGSAQDRRDSEAAGFDAHLTKPVELNELSATLAQLLNPPAAVPAHPKAAVAETS